MEDSPRVLLVALFPLLVACGGRGSPAGDAEAEGGEDVGTDADTPSEPDPDPGPDAEPDPEEDAAGDVEEDAPVPATVTCTDTPPEGAEAPDALPVYAGECPVLAAGRNTISSSGADREFILVLPSDLSDTEILPLLFLWHWIGGSATDFLEKGEVQVAVDDARFIAAIPEEKGDLLLKWPYMVYDTEARIQEEARLFDDILACVAEQYGVNRQCVSSVGVSSGALFTSQLAQRRSRLLSSMVSLSGGVGQSGDVFNPVKPWNGAEHVMPAVVLWGGPSDFCGITFAATSDHLEEALEDDGHFLVECVHNCAHAEPPMEPPPGESKYSSIWTFVLQHPYWLAPGRAPDESSGIPDVFPAWCGIGRGSATIREGECAGGPLGDCF